jgi:hypothetical protein
VRSRKVCQRETYASTKEGCTKPQSKTAAKLGEDLDFYVLTCRCQ